MSQALIDTEEVVRRAKQRLGLELAEKWTLNSILGIGGMASVYAAQHRNQSRVAIKMLHAHFSNDRVIRERFLREGYAGNSIDHRGVVRVLDDGLAEDGSAFVVMDLLEGLSVEQLVIHHGPLSVPHALDFAIQAAEILVAAHRRGVVHRDIKPDNFFVTLDGEVKLLDFGIARVSEEGHSTTVGSFMGTPAYASPEQAKGKWEEVDAQSDVWALGATLFTVLTDQQVHQAETSMEQLALAIHAQPRELEDCGLSIPQDLCDLVNQALRPDKSDRFSSAEALLTALLQLEAEVEEPELHLGELCNNIVTISGESATVVSSGRSSHTRRAEEGERVSQASSRRRRSRSGSGRPSSQPRSPTAAGGTPVIAQHASAPASGSTSLGRKRLWLTAGLLLFVVTAGAGVLLGRGFGGGEKERSPNDRETASSRETSVAARAQPDDAALALRESEEDSQEISASKTKAEGLKKDSQSSPALSSAVSPVAAPAAKPVSKPAPTPQPPAPAVPAPAVPAPAVPAPVQGSQKVDPVVPSSAPASSRDQLLKGRH